MATTKETGLGWTDFQVDSSDGTVRSILSSTNSLDFSTPRGIQDITGLEKLGNQRLLLLADYTISINQTFDDGALASDPTESGGFNVFNDVGSTSVARTTKVVISGQTLTVEVLYSDVTYARSATGEFGLAITGALSDGTPPTWS